MVGRATFTMKKSTRGRAAPSSTVNSPSAPSTGGPAGGRVVWGTRVSVTEPIVRPFPAGYQSLLILVGGVPGNRVRGAAGWRHDDHGGGSTGGHAGVGG